MSDASCAFCWRLCLIQVPCTCTVRVCSPVCRGTLPPHVNVRHLDEIPLPALLGSIFWHVGAPALATCRLLQASICLAREPDCRVCPGGQYLLGEALRAGCWCNAYSWTIITAFLRACILGGEGENANCGRGTGHKHSMVAGSAGVGAAPQQA